MNRRFTSRERQALFLAANGRCDRCGCELLPGWHADHAYPWSRGGETDVINGRALCPPCNREKGANVEHVGAWPDDVLLREWQVDALETYRGHVGDDFLAVATPGAGKTILAARIAHEGLCDQRYRRVVVICPTKHLCRQWANVFARVGIQIDPDCSNANCREAPDFHGMAMTYAQLTEAPKIHRANAARASTFAILDECHHLADPKHWGEKTVEALEPAVRRLHLSGTPFREDDHRIPFIDYVDGNSRSNYNYGYQQALRDQVCRPRGSSDHNQGTNTL